MRFALLYSGYIGNLRRSLNSLKKNLFYIDSDEIDLYIVTKNLEHNVMKYMNKNTLKDINYIQVTGYTSSEIIELSPFNVKSIIEWEKHDNLVEEYNIEVEKFLDRTRNYEYTIPAVLNYDKESKIFTRPSIGSIFEQYFMVDIGLRNIKNSDINYDYVIRFRDRLILKHKIHRNYLNKDIIFLLGWPSKCFICEALVICNENNFIKLFENYHKMICGYRSDKYKDPNFADTDLTFSGECQFALRLFSLFNEENLFHSKFCVKHEVISYKNSDDFGESFIKNLPDDMDECEWRIYNDCLRVI